MVVEQLERDRTDRIFAALSDATRRDIVTRVLESEASVTDLARHYDMSFAAVQKHVAVLERAQLVSKHRRGREQLVRGEVGTVRRAARLLDQLEEIWLHRIAGTDAILADDDGRPDPAMPVIRMRVELGATESGTRATIVSHFASPEQMEQLVQMGFVGGTTDAAGQMDAVLAEG